MKRFSAPVLLLLLLGCNGEAPEPPPSADPAPPAMTSEPAVSTADWRHTPAQDVLVEPGAPVIIQTGPHSVLWPADTSPLNAPYEVRAELGKQSGRPHEGYGLVFGGTALEAPEAEQSYSYFLVRGDGSFLIKKREGTELITVRDWTVHPAIRGDDEAGTATNRLRVMVSGSEVVFFVNDAEVARVPAAELRTGGLAGLRVAHDVRLAVSDFAAARN